MLNIEKLIVAFKGVDVISNLTITIKDGEWISIVGLNGAGKSTLVNAIMGFVKPKSGSISYNGKNLLNLSPQSRAQNGIGCVLEGRQLFKSLTVDEHFSLFHKADRNIGYDLFPVLYKKRFQEVKNLSGGQQQMVAISMAIMTKPNLLILDEPSLGLAPKIMTDIWNCLKKLHNQGMSILLIEQNMASALELCEKAFVMTNGTFAFEGSPYILLKDQKQLSYYLSFEE